MITGVATEYIDVIATYNPLAFGAEMTKPSVCLDGGQVWRTTWTTPVRFAVAPGAHLVEVWAAWITKPEMGRSGVQFTLVPGVGATVSWRVPPTVFQKGKMTVVSGLAAKAVPVEAVQHHAQPSPAMAPAAWHPDPLGRFPLRWWDGSR